MPNVKQILTSLSLLALILLLPPDAPVQGKKSLLERLELLQIAYMISQYEDPFTLEDLEHLMRAAPSIKKDNPKLYKDQERTEKILMLYMVLEELAQVGKQSNGPGRLVGKSRAQVARDFVDRVYRTH